MAKETRTYKDRRLYNIAAVKKRRRNLKLMAIERKGGKCEKCGYKKYYGALEFHHRDPAKKKFDLSTKGLTRSWDRIRKEVNKCLLLCANCHRETHESIRLKESASF